MLSGGVAATGTAKGACQTSIEAGGPDTPSAVVVVVLRRAGRGGDALVVPATCPRSALVLFPSLRVGAKIFGISSSRVFVPSARANVRGAAQKLEGTMPAVH